MDIIGLSYCSLDLSTFFCTYLDNPNLPHGPVICLSGSLLALDRIPHYNEHLARAGLGNDTIGGIKIAKVGDASSDSRLWTMLFLLTGHTDRPLSCGLVWPWPSAGFDRGVVKEASILFQGLFRPRLNCTQRYCFKDSYD